ncbi:hypothetical protein EVAR_88500_1 [Eumeta japonica]|uniref:Uncharacterized protein n=1 Tax=Eumeta variegata TaxID=151549 RepID=A0A4C1XTD8_EUMVA|nr:hypothetical protein EVAR_88500_1 [Eumeta japonica]
MNRRGVRPRPGRSDRRITTVRKILKRTVGYRYHLRYSSARFRSGEGLRRREGGRRPLGRSRGGRRGSTPAPRVIEGSELTFGAHSFGSCAHRNARTGRRKRPI